MQDFSCRTRLHCTATFAFLHRYSFESLPPLLGHKHRFGALCEVRRSSTHGCAAHELFSEFHQGEVKMTTKTYKNLIDGKWVTAESGKTFLNYNPANVDDVVG